eukprot:jgi/Psemu1/319445/estExt_fgenesh1_pm.C_2230004
MWDVITATAKSFGDSATNKAKQGKLKADILMIERSMESRKRAFGVAMYDYLSPLSQSADFYAATDKLTELVRPNLILAQKEIQALAARRVKQKESLAMAEADRAAAFPTKAETYGQKLINFGKAGIYHGGEAKIKTELSVTDRLIKGYKEEFGVALYNAFSDAEDKEGFLPTDRQIRNVYDTCRQDLTSLEQQRKSKEDEIVELGGKRSSSETPSITEQTPSTTTANSTNDYNPGHGDFTAPQQTPPFPTNTQQSPMTTQIAGSGIFSHPVVTSSAGPVGYSNNADQFAPAASSTTVDPFSTFTSSNTFSDNQPSSEQGKSSDVLLRF